MALFSSWGLRAKLIFLVVVLSLLLAGAAVSVKQTINKVQIGGRSYRGIELKYDNIDAMARLRVNLNFLNSILKGQILDEYDADELNEIRTTITEKVTALKQVVSEQTEGDVLTCNACHSLERAGDIVAAIGVVDLSWQKIATILDHSMIPALEAEDGDAAADILDEAFYEPYSEMMDATKLIVDNLRQALLAMKENTVSQARRFSSFFIGASIVVIVLFLAGGILAGNMISRQINTIVGELNDSADRILSEMRVTSGTSQTTAEMASEMAASLEETSAAIEEIASMINQNEENSGQVNEAMRGNLELNKIVHGHMAEMQQTLGKNQQDSRKISSIIDEIDAIAFQTNLLALNAAVEAARAGESGAGFAVVADEVRNLAQRAAGAAQNSKKLIDVAVSGAEEGIAKMQDIAARMADAFASSEKVGALIEQIVTASRQQSQGINQVNTSTAEMDNAVQKLAAGAEELAAAAESVTNLLQNLHGAIIDLRAIVEGGGGRAADGGTTMEKGLVPVG